MNNILINVLAFQSPVLNLSVAQTIVVVLLAGLGAFYAGQLTTRFARWAFAL